MKTKTKKHKNKNKKVYKKEENKSLFVSLKCSTRYSHVKRFTACSKTRSIVKHFCLSSDFYVLSNLFFFYYKFWSGGTQRFRNLFHYFKNV